MEDIFAVGSHRVMSGENGEILNETEYALDSDNYRLIFPLKILNKLQTLVIK